MAAGKRRYVCLCVCVCVCVCSEWITSVYLTLFSSVVLPPIMGSPALNGQTTSFKPPVMCEPILDIWKDSVFNQCKLVFSLIWCLMSQPGPAGLLAWFKRVLPLSDWETSWNIYIYIYIYIHTHTISQKFLNSNISLCFYKKEVSSAHQACIYLIQSKAKTEPFWHICTI